MLDGDRWARIQELFHEAADRPAAERRPWLEAACADDPALVNEVLELLEEDERGDSLLDRSLAHVAHGLLDHDAALPDASFGPYRIRRLLGEGGMGVVYLAQREDLGSLAAIKILRDAWLSPARRERFLSEQRTLAQLNHPAIAQLFDADTLPDGTPWFVMEYVEGEILTAWCRARHTPLPERLRLFRSVCEAVQHAHRHAVIHRDLKPSNIMVKPDGSVKLLDFGIARQLESLEIPIEQTQTGLRLMTPAYAAPEQLLGGRMGIHTDVYSLGVLLYELLAGRLPHDLAGKTAAEIEELVTRQAPLRPSLAATAPDASPETRDRARYFGKGEWADLDVLCLTAMHVDPQRRYQTVDALIRDLDRFGAGQPLEARPDSVGYRLNKFVRRNRGPVLASALAAAAVVALVIFYTVRLTTARNAALSEAARTERIQRFTMRLFEGGDAEVGPADSLRVISLVDRGLQEARGLGADPAMQAELYQTLGSIYQKLGNLSRADTLLQAALDHRRARFRPGTPELTGALVGLGYIRVEQARYDEAEQLVREALESGRRALPDAHPAVAQATFALGKVLQARGSYDQAILVAEDAVRRYTPPGDSVTAELAGSLAELAASHFYAGHYEVSDSLNRRILAMYRRLHGERHPLVASVLINLGASQFDRGHYPEAERFHREGLAVYQAFYGAEHPEIAYAMTMLGRALVFQEKWAEATELLGKALVIRERVFGPENPAVASTLNEIGSVALQQNRLDEAEQAFARMVEIYRKVYHGKHSLIGIAQSNLASVYVKREQYPRAEQLYREVLLQYDGLIAPDHVNVGITRIKLGRALLRQGRHADAAAESLAGYEILIKQTNPGVSFLRAARTDLALAYEALGARDKAARFRAELADTARAAAAVKQ
jgi:serine/threonine protein kinase/tetratricopeptide (TPR) repeat protein